MLLTVKTDLSVKCLENEACATETEMKIKRTIVFDSDLHARLCIKGNRNTTM